MRDESRRLSVLMIGENPISRDIHSSKNVSSPSDHSSHLMLKLTYGHLTFVSRAYFSSKAIEFQEFQQSITINIERSHSSKVRWIETYQGLKNRSLRIKI